MTNNPTPAFNGNISAPSVAASDQTYLMATSPVASSRSADGYRPRIISTVGQRPAVLVSASVTYVGNNEIYAFGGFDQYTDEVYNHVLRLNLETRQWNLVDNYGDIPGVRMGHTATLWHGDKVLIFGGENEHRAYLNDVIEFDLKTAHWSQHELNGAPPRGRARHSAAIYDDKLFVVGGLSGHDNSTILDDYCYLDLKTWTWSRSWRFVPRFDHICWVWGGKLCVFGGLTEGMERPSELWCLDLKQSPILNSQLALGYTRPSASVRQPRPPLSTFLPPLGSTGYAANSSSIQTSTGHGPTRKPPMAPGSISSVNFVSGPHLPSPAAGMHFHAYSSGCLLDFATPVVSGALETSLSALDLESIRWEKLSDGRELFHPSYRWHYCTLNQEGTHAWLLGTSVEAPANNPIAVNGAGPGEYLSDVLSIDLRKMGLLGNNLTATSSLGDVRLPSSDAHLPSHLSGIGADLARKFDRDPATGSGADFVVTAEKDDVEDDDMNALTDQAQPSSQSKPIHVHRFILEARWPHFARMIAAQMAEFHSRKLHIPESYATVRTFLMYLYTDSIAPHPELGPTLEEVAGMLVLSNVYDMPRLRLLCRNRLGRELDVESAAVIWERASLAGEDWLKRRAARFCMTHWGRVVRTAGFQNLKRVAMLELCQEVDTEGRVVGAEELEVVGGLGGVRLGSMMSREQRYGRLDSSGTQDDDDDDEGMELS